MTFYNSFPLFWGQLDCSAVELQLRMTFVGMCPGNGPETDNQHFSSKKYLSF